jgi:probable rRNA maturation factor
MPVRLVVNNGPFRGVAAHEVARRARAMMAVLKRGSSELSIVLTDDEQIHELNKLYRHKDRPTDVLAFAMTEGEFSELSRELLGDVIISVPTAARQARERGVALMEEVTMLLGHGLLHLLGWDHQTAKEDKAMRAETERLCAAAAPLHRRRNGGSGKKKNRRTSLVQSMRPKK